MRKESFTIADLIESCDAAIRSALSYLVANARPSFWNPDAKGWKELWSADYAGFYASCDGIIVFSTLKPRDRLTTMEEGLLSTLFHHHLKTVMDRSVPVSSQHQEIMRKETLNTTMKVAKFVQASYALDPITGNDDPILQQAVDYLVREGRTMGGRWRASPDSGSPASIAATAEACRALYCLRDRNLEDLLTQGLSFLAQTFETDEVSKKLIAAWVISSQAGDANAQPSGLSQSVEFIENCLSRRFDYSSLYREEFISIFTRVDFYTYNLGCLLATSAFSLMLSGHLSTDWLVAPLEFMLEVLEDLLIFGRLTTQRHGRDETFWDNAQALEALGAFRNVLKSAKTSERGAFMYVNPVVFQGVNSMPNRKLIVVLMPLKKLWSNDILNAFETVAREQGFIVWRSDLDHRDDFVMQTIWQKINECRLVIADCTDRNPNVFYELGIAHVIGKAVFICAQSRKDIPFDIAHVRSYEYGTLPHQMDKLRSDLKAFLSNIN